MLCCAGLLQWNVLCCCVQVRLALALADVPFTDNRVKGSDWAAMKASTKYGQMPVLEIDGKEVNQSGAMMRHAG